MSNQTTAQAMLSRNGYKFETHGSGYGFYVCDDDYKAWKFYTPVDAINLVIDGQPVHKSVSTRMLERGY